MPAHTKLLSDELYICGLGGLSKELFENENSDSSIGMHERNAPWGVALVHDRNATSDMHFRSQGLRHPRCRRALDSPRA